MQSGALPCPKIPGSHVASAKPRELSTWLRAREKRLIVPEMMSAWRPGLSVIAVLWPCEVPDVRTQQNLPTPHCRFERAFFAFDVVIPFPPSRGLASPRQ